MKDYLFQHTEPFRELTGLSYEAVHCKINKELKRNGLTVDDLDWGKPLINLLQNNETNIMGFLVCAFVDFEFESETLSLLTDVVIVGHGKCETCGGDPEHDETIVVGKYEIEVKLKCNICGSTSYEWIPKDEKYYE